MLNEFMRNQAELYVGGAMAGPGRKHFEIVLYFHRELREFVGHLARLSLRGVSPVHSASPSAGTWVPEARNWTESGAPPAVLLTDVRVVSGLDGLVQWVNPAFASLSGYNLDEVRGKKLGPLLQGPGTSMESVGRIRSALRSFQPCRETLLNYHRSGAPYRVEIDVETVFDEASRPLWFVARQRKLDEVLAG